MFSTINTIGSGISAMKTWLDTSSNNIANMNTTRTAEGQPYHRQTVAFKEKKAFDDLFSKQIGGGVKADRIIEDKSEKIVYNPKHPDANEEGYVRLPAINLTAELSNIVMAQRSYEANVTAFNQTKQVMKKELQIGQV